MNYKQFRETVSNSWLKMDRSIIFSLQSFTPVRPLIHVTMEELARLMSRHTDVIALVQITTDQCAK